MQNIDAVLEAGDVIDLRSLRSACFSGIPDEDSYRSVCWRLLLHYLPCERSTWTDTLLKQRRTYESLVEDLIVAPSSSTSSLCPLDSGDHPLSTSPKSLWSEFFRDNEVLLQIDKDVRRLCPEMQFFQQPTEYPAKYVMSGRAEPLSKRVSKCMLASETLITDRSGVHNLSTKQALEEYKSLPDGHEAQWEVVERILFIYYKLNPGVKYVQGMNEILGPIYYVFASDNDKEWSAYAEPDAFFCFQNLMSEIKDFFIKTLDNSLCGIDHEMTKLYQLLESVDNALYVHLTQTVELLPQYFAFRWISLLLSQEFKLPDVIQIWDSFFADESRFDFLLYVCASMLVCVRKELIDGDFSSNLKLLQNYPPVDVGRIVSIAADIRQACAEGRSLSRDLSSSSSLNSS